MMNLSHKCHFIYSVLATNHTVVKSYVTLLTGVPDCINRTIMFLNLLHNAFTSFKDIVFFGLSCVTTKVVYPFFLQPDCVSTGE